jgi:hypothetical protein
LSSFIRIISNPFLLGATIEYHLDSYHNSIADKVKDDIYVDNVITGIDGDEEVFELYRESKRMFKEASMNLRGWTSNSAKLN